MKEQVQFISEWLQEPYTLNESEQQAMGQLLARYPYLLPAQWMHSSTEFNQHGFSNELLNDSQLFTGNWLQFYQSMKSSGKGEKVILEKKLEPALVDAKAFTTERIVSQEASFSLNSERFAASLSEEHSDLSETLIQPVYVENYFQHEGIEVSDVLSEAVDTIELPSKEAEEKALMVMMGFEEWLMFLKKKNEAKKSEEEDKASIRSMWQREKLAAAIGEEDDNIPEAVFEMAINSIDKHDLMVSEPLAEIHVKQGRYEKAIEIYRKLSLQNPEKKTYFAAKINHLNKENLS